MGSPVTSNRPIPQGVSAREAGRQLKVSHSYLLRLAGQKRLPRHEDGSFDVAACCDWLAKNTDPAQVRGPAALRWSKGGNKTGRSVTGDQPATSTPWTLALEAAEHAADPFEKGVIVAVVMLAHRIGAGVAALVADDAAPLPVAFAVADLATLAFIELGEDAVRQLPSFAQLPNTAELPLRYSPENCDRVDWNVVAHGRGEAADVAAWAAEIRRRRAAVAA